MSTSFIQIPTTKYAPAYNNIKFIADSTNKNLSGFRYVFDIYSAGTVTLSSTTRIDELIVAPRLNDGYGVVYLEEIFQNFLTYDFDKTNIGLTNPINSWKGFDIYVGEAYTQPWDYDDFEFFSSTASTNGHIQLRQFASATTHSFVVGDQVNITQDDLPCAPTQINGLHVVTEVPSPYAIILELVYLQVVGQGACPAGGTVAFADNRRTISRHQIMTSITAFNAAFPMAEPYVESKYMLSSMPFSGKSFLTTCPRDFRNTPEQNMWFNLMNDESANVGYVTFTNSNGDILRKTITSLTQPFRQIGVGAANAEYDTVISGSTPLVKANTEWYDVEITTTGGTILTTVPHRINIDRRCTIDYGFETFEIVFLDRLGSFGSFALPLKFKDTTKVTKNDYNKDNEFYQSSSDLTEGGITNYQIKLERELELNTNHMTEEESKYFDEIFTSPNVMLLYKGQYIRVTVSDDDFETIYQRNRNLIRRTIKVKPSLQDNTNA